MAKVVDWQDADQVTDETSFLAFVDALARDRADEVRTEAISPSHPMCAGANGWQNGAIETYLDAAHAWGTVSMNGIPQPISDQRPSRPPYYTPPTNPWTRVAHILLAGKYYE